MLTMFDDVCFPFYYAGYYDKSVVYNYGDIVRLKDGLFAVCRDVGCFDYIECSTDSVKEPDPVQPRITQCRNCGAPTDRDGYCYYCGTYN